MIVKTLQLNIYVLSVGGMIDKEALFVLTDLTQIMAEKLEEHISHVRG